MGVVVRRYIDFLVLLIPTPLVYVLFCSSIPTFCSFKKMFFVLFYIQHASDDILKCDVVYIYRCALYNKFLFVPSTCYAAIHLNQLSPLN